MSLDWIRVSLRGFGGDAPIGHGFFEALGLENARDLLLRPSDEPDVAASVVLFEVAMGNVISAPEPAEAFAASVRNGFAGAAARLGALRREAFDAWRAAGRHADVFVSGWLDDQQFDLEVPGEFLRACGELGLPMTICTND